MLKKLYLVAIGLCMLILSCYLTLNIIWMITNNNSNQLESNNNQTNNQWDNDNDNITNNKNQTFSSHHFAGRVSLPLGTSRLISDTKANISSPGDKESSSNNNLLMEQDIRTTVPGIDEQRDSYLSSVSRAWRSTVPSPSDLARRWWSSWSTYVPMRRSIVSSNNSSEANSTIESTTTLEPNAILNGTGQSNDTLDNLGQLPDLSPLILTDEQLAKMFPNLVNNTNTRVLLLRCDKTFAYIRYLANTTINRSSITTTTTTTNTRTNNNHLLSLARDDIGSTEPTRPFGPLEQIVRPHNQPAPLLRQEDRQSAALRLTKDVTGTQRRETNWQEKLNYTPGHYSEISESFTKDIRPFSEGNQQPQLSQQIKPNASNNEQLDGPQLQLVPLNEILPGPMVDCYLVDINKRPDEMHRFESMFSSSTNRTAEDDKEMVEGSGILTREIGFDVMLSLMVECRRLSLEVELDEQQESRSSSSSVIGVDEDQHQQQPEQQPQPNIRGWSLRQPVRAATGKRQSNFEPSSTNTTNSSTLGSGGVSSVGSGSGSSSLTTTMMGGIAPGTNWCGLGDQAQGYRHLGPERRVDVCCRAHDHCPIRLKPFTYDYGLSNWSVYTRSHCKCDIDLSDCLQRSNSTLGQVIRLLYFKFVGTQCIELYPTINNNDFNTSTISNQIVASAAIS